MPRPWEDPITAPDAEATVAVPPGAGGKPRSATVWGRIAPAPNHVLQLVRRACARARQGVDHGCAVIGLRRTRGQPERDVLITRGGNPCRLCCERRVDKVEAG